MVDMKDKALALLSIAAKAGKIVSGGFMCENAIKDGTASLVPAKRVCLVVAVNCFLRPYCKRAKEPHKMR